MKKVITYGTFDLFHQGHYNILKRAKALGDYLIVGVTSESYDIERGKLNVKDDLLTRINHVKETGFADEIIVEEYQGQKINDVMKYHIDTLVVGSDWIGKFDYLKEYCEVVYLERTKDISSTQLRLEQKKTYKVGIVTDDQEYFDVVQESKYVSGIHVDGICCQDIALAEKIQNRYELNQCTSDYDELLKLNDIIFIEMPMEKRYSYVEKAVMQGKKVICPAPIIRDTGKLQELFDRAKETGALICEDIILAYLRAFNQLVWLVHGQLIGKIFSVHCSISNDPSHGFRDVDELLSYAIFLIIKLVNKNYENIDKFTVVDAAEEPIYSKINITFKNAIATIEIGEKSKIGDYVKIIGEKGVITIPDVWWNLGYFEAEIENQDKLKRYSSNFEGDGYRYLLQEILSMIETKRTESIKIFSDESYSIVEILNKINSIKPVV